MTTRYPVGVREPRPRGRPRVEEPGSSVSTWLPQGYHDRLVKMAKDQAEGNISALVRSLIIMRLKT